MDNELNANHLNWKTSTMARDRKEKDYALHYQIMISARRPAPVLYVHAYDDANLGFFKGPVLPGIKKLYIYSSKRLNNNENNYLIGPKR